MSVTEPLHIGRYEIRAELGRGGMAVVYRGFDPQTQREVAIKVLPPQFLNDPDFRTRFEREAHTVARLEHSAIVPLYDYGEDRGQLYFVMRLMPGGSLADRLQHGPLPVDEVSRIITHLAPALDEAHAHGVVHRDLKPGNILFDNRGDPYVSDFGIAKIRESSSTFSTSGVIGTPAYMSPEQARGERDLTGRSDIYALGTILFEMLTGKLPYEADTPMGLALRHIMEPVPRILEVKPDLPAGCNTIIERAMAKETSARYVTVAEMAGALASVQHGETPTLKSKREHRPPTVRAVPPSTRALPGKPATRPDRSRRGTPMWVWALLGGAALLVVFITTAIIVGALIIPATIAASPTPDSVGQTAALTSAAQSQLAATQQAQTQATTDAQSTIDASAGLATTQAELAAQMTADAVVQSTIDAAGAAAANAEATASARLTAAAQAEATSAALLTAPKIAFFNANDVWVVNVDGSNLQQITFDGADKTNLRWLPDGQTVAYISGRCIQTVNFATKETGSLGCFNSSEVIEGFEISPDSKYFAISVDRQLFVGDYKPEALAQITLRSQLERLANCMFFTRSATKSLHWSQDSAKIAVMVIGVLSNGQAADTIQLLKLRCGDNNPANLDQFPGTRFELPAYAKTRTLQNFGWDGNFLFALIDNVRNDGFGDLYLYNTDTKRRPVKVNPIEETCCYRDPQWSPDGKFLVFAFQDIRLGQNSKTQLYYVPFGTLTAGGKFTPIPLPEAFFADPRERPQPVVAPPAP